MQFGEYNFKTYNFANKPELNGGLYTGEEFRGNWGTVPIIPDTVFMTTNHLRSANPPMEALTQFGNSSRPGNNHHNVQSSHKLSKNHNIVCTGTHTKNKKIQPHDPMNHTNVFTL